MSNLVDAYRALSREWGLVQSMLPEDLEREDQMLDVLDQVWRLLSESDRLEVDHRLALDRQHEGKQVKISTISNVSTVDNHCRSRN